MKKMLALGTSGERKIQLKACPGSSFFDVSTNLTLLEVIGKGLMACIYISRYEIATVSLLRFCIFFFSGEILQACS